jgi:ribonuclease VapC
VILDSSAVVAVLRREPSHDRLLDRIAADTRPGIGAPTLVETAIVLTARVGDAARTLLARFLQEAEVAVLPFDGEHWPVALDAFERYGKGRDRAGLNLGDCLTYATARLAQEPLLTLGNDFARTDLELVEP